MFLRVLRTEVTKQLWIFSVLVILWSPICAKMAFLLNFNQKSPLGTHHLHKMTQAPNIQNLFGNFCCKYPKKAHSYTKLGQLDHFPRI